MIRTAMAIIFVFLLAMPAHAVVFWDDELESGNTNISAAYMQSTLIPQGIMAYDTSVKFSGAGSLRLNYPSSCYTVTPSSACGGSVARMFPPVDDFYQRIYFRMSGAGPNPTSSGVFRVASTVFTKMMKGEGTAATNGLIPRHWWTMGCCGSKNFGISEERVPVNPTNTTVEVSSITFLDNRWYCIETQVKMNDVGIANGIARAWVDGVQVLNDTDVLWRNSGMDTVAKWNQFGLFRQVGEGNIWYDRAAVGDTRIGCIGATQGDTTPPAKPQGWTVN